MVTKCAVLFYREKRCAGLPIRNVSQTACMYLMDSSSQAKSGQAKSPRACLGSTAPGSTSSCSSPTRTAKRRSCHPSAPVKPCHATPFHMHMQFTLRQRHRTQPRNPRVDSSSDYPSTHRTAKRHVSHSLRQRGIPDFCTSPQAYSPPDTNRSVYLHTLPTLSYQGLHAGLENYRDHKMRNSRLDC